MVVPGRHGRYDVIEMLSRRNLRHSIGFSAAVNRVLLRWG